MPKGRSCLLWPNLVIGVGAFASCVVTDMDVNSMVPSIFPPNLQYPHPQPENQDSPFLWIYTESTALFPSISVATAHTPLQAKATLSKCLALFRATTPLKCPKLD